MKDQSEKSALRKAVLKALSSSATSDPRAAALELAALTLALEAGARMGRSGEELSRLSSGLTGDSEAEPWTVELLYQARACLAEPQSAEGVWKEALTVIHPLGMDLS